MRRKQIYEKKVIRGAMRPLAPEQVSAISTILHTREKWRDLALFRLGIDTMLRASDLVRVLVEEVRDHRGGIVDRATILMKKTRTPVEVFLSEETREAVAKWLAERRVKSKWLFDGLEPEKNLTEIRYRQLCKAWFDSIGLSLKHYSTHSIRRTKAKAIYAESKNLKAVSRLLGHRDTKVTELYLGVTQEEAVELAARVKI